MSQYFLMHPQTPQLRLIRETARIIREGGVIIYPTDATCAIGCQLADARAIERIRHLRDLSEVHYFTLVCRDLSDIGTYARVDTPAFRFLKAHTPGPFTFILQATREVPNRLLQPKRNTIGLRVPDSRIVQAILAELGEPLMSVSLVSDKTDHHFADAQEILEVMGHQVDLIIDDGRNYGVTPTTVVDLTGEQAKVMRQGSGIIVS